MNLVSRVASRHLSAEADACHLRDYGLEGLLQGEPVTVYHGTTRMFRHFDLKHARPELVNAYYGVGIFFVPDKGVARQYADANRNMGFPPSLVGDLTSRNRRAGAFLQGLVERGRDVWDDYTRESLKLEPGDDYGDAVQEAAGGVDPNTLSDIAGWVLGSKFRGLPQDEGFTNIFSTSTGMPGYAYDSLDEVGLDSFDYRPKVYTVRLSGCERVLVTKKKPEARSARARGYDAVVFCGSDLVGGVPEVAVFDPSKAKVLKVEPAYS